MACVQGGGLIQALLKAVKPLSALNALNDATVELLYACVHACVPLMCMSMYRIAGNFGGKNIWRIALIMAFGGFYFGGWVSLMP